ncbi:MAG: hypothetical protein KAT35_05120, partial [Candidatus Aenigmarchaeota archaeon]|nr:hypothetical protein [Candidatus Aenigmarchaeota archaeon]
IKVRVNAWTDTGEDHRIYARDWTGGTWGSNIVSITATSDGTTYEGTLCSSVSDCADYVSTLDKVRIKYEYTDDQTSTALSIDYHTILFNVTAFEDGDDWWNATYVCRSSTNITWNSIFASDELAQEQSTAESMEILCDAHAPSPSLEQSNVTTPDPLVAVEFGAYWNDVGDADLSRYIFSWNATDSWVNDSDLAFSGAEGVWTNTTKQINAAWEGKIIGWLVWANDSLGNTDVSTEKTITVNSDNPSVEIELPTNESTIYSTQDIFTTITDAGTIESTIWRWENSTDNGDWTTLAQGSPSSNYTSSWDTTTVIDGEYWLRAFANDSSDNENNTYYLVTVDNTVPETWVLAPANNTNSSVTTVT